MIETEETLTLGEIQYTRVGEEFFADIEQQLMLLKAADSKKAFSAIFLQINSLRNHYATQKNLVSIRHSIDTADPFYEKEQDYYDEIDPRFLDFLHRFKETVLNSPYREQVSEQTGEYLLDQFRLSLNTFDKSITEELGAENKLVSQYNKVVSGAEILFRGNIYNLSTLLPFEESTDRETRREAKVARFGFYEKHESELGNIYHKLVQTRTRTARKLGYRNYTGLGYARMLRTDYGTEEVKKFREAIEKYIVPVAVRIAERKRERLGLEALYFYDESLSYKEGNPLPTGSPEDILRAGGEMYSALSPETDEFYKFMTDRGLLEVLSKPNKSPGGYCNYLPKPRYPFIFSNFNGTSDDIDVLTHEAGHAFQVFCSRNYTVPEYYFPTMEACEIHSMSMEFFTWPWMKNFFGEQTERYYQQHLSSSISTLLYTAAIDEFQHLVYEYPEVSTADRFVMWKCVEKKYMPYRQYDGLEYLEKGGLWQRQGHLYWEPFYYIDYALAQVCALQFWSQSQQDWPEAWERYVYLCKAGGSKPFTELVRLAGLRSPFEEEVIKQTIDKVVMWLEKHEMC